MRDSTRSAHGAFTFALIWLVLPVLLLTGRASAEPPIVYTVRFPAPQTHYMEVEAVIPADGETIIELMMAVWTPGSYLVREYAQHVEHLLATDPDGRPLSISSSAKNRWTVETSGASTITVSYRVYSREMSVRTNWVDRDFALINGAPTFITVENRLDEPHEIILQLPTEWARSVTSLSAAPGGGAHHFRAPDFDALVDSPIVAGNPTIREFTVNGTVHALVNVGDESRWDGRQAVADMERIVRQHHDLYGHFPYERYLFLNLITEAGGGLEHKASSVLMTSRWQMRDRARYLDWLTLVSHELFHAWNGKRLRPVELGPFDYESEVHTRSLWVTEGLTAYYAPLLVHRAGLSTRGEYLAELSSEIRTLQTTPGRLEQSVEQASYDAWIKFYRPNENSRNTTVSYYTKGAVIGFLLDARIRRVSGGARSLDDVMRLAFQRYAGERGFTPAEFRETVVDAAGAQTGVGSWLDAALGTPSELDYTEALDWYGLDRSGLGNASAPGSDAEAAPGWLGLQTRVEGANIIAARVLRDTPGFAAGFTVDDEILAIDDYRVRAHDWTERLSLYRADESASILIARRGRLMRLAVTFGQAPGDDWNFTIRQAQTPSQPHRIDAWLGAVQGP